MSRLEWTLEEIVNNLNQLPEKLECYEYEDEAICFQMTNYTHKPIITEKVKTKKMDIDKTPKLYGSKYRNKEIKREFKCSKCRSKIIENLEGLQDCLTKIINRSKQDLINKINTL